MKIIFFLITIVSLSAKAKMKLDSSQMVSGYKLEFQRHMLIETGGSDGTDVGNGGFAVNCGAQWFFYDLFDYQLKHSQDDIYRKYDLSLNSDTIVRLMLENLWLLNEELANSILINYERALELFYDKERADAAYPFLKAKIPNQGRKSLLNEIQVDSHCQLRQIISYVRPMGYYLSDTNYMVPDYYSVNNSIFDKLDSLNQAIAMLHESIYPLLFDLVSNKKPIAIPLTQFIFSLPDVNSLTIEQKIYYNKKLSKILINNDL